MTDPTAQNTASLLPPPVIYDPIVELLERILPTSFFDEPAVEAVSFSITVLPPRPPKRPTKLYKISYKKSPARPEDLVTAWAEIKLERSSSTNASKLSVRHDGEWIPLLDWLSDAFPAPVEQATTGFGSAQWHMNYEWACNGKAFNFLGLSRELRNLIYDQAADSCYPYFWRKGWNFLGLRAADTADHALLPADYGATGARARTEYKTRACKIVDGAASILSILLLNRQVSGEFKERLLKHTEFRFLQPRDLGWFLCQNALGSSPFDGMIPHKLSVEFSLTTLFFTFGTWNLSGLVPIETDLLGVLSNLQLKSLSVYVDHQTKQYNKDIREHGREYCHRLFKGRFFLLLREATRHVPEVTILGCIRPATKALFDKMHSCDLEGQQCDITEWDFLGNSRALRRAGLSYTSPWLELVDLAHTLDRNMCHLFSRKHSFCRWYSCTADGCSGENYNWDLGGFNESDS